MTKIMLIVFCALYPFAAAAQFAAGYAPDERQNGAPSSVFRQQPQQPAPESMPAPREPENIQKPTPYTGTLRILARVNGDIITTEDINNRVRAFCMTTGIPYNRQTKLLIINKVMQNTIDEKLKLQEAARNQVEISRQDVDNAVKVFCQNNNISPEKLKQMLEQFGVSEDVFREQLKTDLSWIRVVQRNSMNETVTQPEIENALALARRDMSKPKFMVAEIVIPAKDAKNISELTDNLRRDPRFELYAAQFSQSPSSSSGGNLGWVSDGQLPAPLNEAVKKLAPGEVSEPILYNGSYYIYKVERTFDPAKDKLPEPSAKEAASLLQNRKNERFAEKRMQELRQQATIELKE